MLEAIKKIQAAELENEQLKEALITKLKVENELQEQTLQKIKEQAQKETAQEVEQLEANLKEALQLENAELLLTAEKKRASYQQLYDEKKSKAVGAIIERVKQTYGRL
ncbi:hypothetical protein BAU15_04050 [Enterococcus sp. JM4C]|uniref:type VI secretion system contractile sheath protein TssC n=1 Tax=Candidatus Enterococcus huntleyi TaxID=1857217 RepID=UPI0013796045|nr:type VI secretion system contractile sheath protein TssC [Enterococcus sp. JM4C]KAF1295716.1 hypothetical protein BAU15_04050 [Enterococcus sp. JM4C]